MEVALTGLAVLVMIALTAIASRIVYVAAYNASTVSKANKFGTEGLCCCGSMLEDHRFGCNHGFVSEIGYFIESNHKCI